MKVLHLTLKKKWFDMIASGEKLEEYREIKPYWVSRLVDELFSELEATDETFYWKGAGPFSMLTAHHYDIVKFKNGYSKDAPELQFKVHSIVIWPGRSDWGAEPGKKYFVIKLGERIC